MMLHRFLTATSLLAALLVVASLSVSFAQTPIVEVWPSLPNAANGAISYATQLTPIVSASSETSHVLKAGPGNVFTVSAANMGGSSGFLVLLNATSVPSDGAIAPLACAALAANGNAVIAYAPGPPAAYSVGIVAVITTGATCFTKTTGAATGFISGLVM